jgi:hypothetical protein
VTKPPCSYSHATRPTEAPAAVEADKKANGVGARKPGKAGAILRRGSEIRDAYNAAFIIEKLPRSIWLDCDARRLKSM